MLDKGPCGLKVLANKFKCKESLFTAVETRIWELGDIILKVTVTKLLSNLNHPTVIYRDEVDRERA